MDIFIETLGNMDHLATRGWYMPNRCILCKQDAETVDHLFIHCSVARSLWMLLFNMFGVQWVLPSSTYDLLAGVNNGGFPATFARKGYWKTNSDHKSRYNPHQDKLHSKQSPLLVFVL